MNARWIGAAMTALGVGALAAAAGEESAHEQALKQMIRALDKLTTTLSGIKDAETAQAARPELRKAVEGWTATKKKLEELPPPGNAEKDRLQKEYKGKVDEATKKLFTEIGRVRMFPAGKDVLQEMAKVLPIP
jgi:cytochrome c556